jgi:methionine-rich copper-binding protein CopC
MLTRSRHRLVTSGRGGWSVAVMICAIAIAAVIAVSPSAAFAHAVVVSSQPPANGVVRSGVLRVRLQFSSRVDRERSRLTLIDPHGKETTIAIAASDAPGAVSAQARVDAPGRWILRWQVLSIDGHVTRGDVPFSVDGAGG